MSLYSRVWSGREAKRLGPGPGLRLQPAHKRLQLVQRVLLAEPACTALRLLGINLASERPQQRATARAACPPPARPHHTEEQDLTCPTAPQGGPTAAAVPPACLPGGWPPRRRPRPAWQTRAPPLPPQSCWRRQTPARAAAPQTPASARPARAAPAAAAPPTSSAAACTPKEVA